MRAARGQRGILWEGAVGDAGIGGRGWQAERGGPTPSSSRAELREIREELARILAAKVFAGAERPRHSLRFIVEETLAGRAAARRDPAVIFIAAEPYFEPLRPGLASKPCAPGPACRSLDPAPRGARFRLRNGVRTEVSDPSPAKRSAWWTCPGCSPICSRRNRQDHQPAGRPYRHRKLLRFVPAAPGDRGVRLGKPLLLRVLRGSGFAESHGTFLSGRGPSSAAGRGSESPPGSPARPWPRSSRRTAPACLPRYGSWDRRRATTRYSKSCWGSRL